jgi:hypothetical protein
VPLPPVRRLAEPRTVRLVATARLRDPVLLGLVRKELLDDLAEIDSATSGRLLAQARGLERLEAGELAMGLAGAGFINAAFTYFRPRELNRFNGPGRGAWYAARLAEVAMAEVAFHMTRELERVDDFHATVDYAELIASFAGRFFDLRGVVPTPVCLDPDPAVGYPAGNALAEQALARGLNGIVWPSVRDRRRRDAFVALLPHAVQSVVQGRVLRLAWAGSREPTLTRLAG